MSATYDYRIVTDTASDLPASYYEEHDIRPVHLSTILEDVTYNEKNPLDIDVFYQKLADGAMPSTSQPNPEDCKEILEDELKKSKNLLVLAFSSGLSGTYQSFRIAADELLEENSDAQIIVIDTLCASLGEGLMVHKAVTLRDQGKSMEEVADWVTAHIQNLCHAFTVDDLFHLQRGGRLSKTSAILGSMIQIKPLLLVDGEGHLVALSKCRGRKKALSGLVDLMEERLGSYRDQNDVIFISHSHCQEDAQLVADEIKKRFGYETFLIDYIGTVIASHTGIGTVALFFMGEHR